MKTMKLWWMPYAFVVIGLGFATVYDCALNAWLYDPNQIIALFFERFLLLPIEGMVPVCFFAFYQLYQERRFLFCYGIASIYIVMDVAHYYVPLSENIWWILLPALGLTMILYMGLKQIDVSYWRSQERFLWFICAVILTTLLVTFVLKQVWGRVRFREMFPDLRQFTPWFLPQGMNGHHSFPSAHTALMSTSLCLLFRYRARASKRPIPGWNVLLIFVFILMMMVMRMVAGAHFLSDVLMGFALTYTIVLLYAHRFFRLDRKQY